ncbi:TetR/AcrR family transcriptional regulator [Marinomonas sp. 15G1-11]|uniref:TetR/AcrR family transcriptional regulator n=1 Tax=Marinomonas phaeophyticola TaxID=3004091 RepID=A0ABT4JVT7_9GAMM|nr:TetR/AcrR family transcriptional regulator [Marinomonas sp. 15G1-11]MCZ2722482.1 TetR/AcrR family transcriptional regulator [Marinomonas sp. 15G1-11]
MTKKEALLMIAENKVRQGGYSNFSFRELAKEVGIKSASVHYHFPTKADLGAELARRYADSFLSALGDPDVIKVSGKHPIDVFIGLFQNALITDKQMCLCGLLGAESDSLPESVRLETKHFFERNLVWLKTAYLSLGYSENSARYSAIKAISLLEGAMMVSKAVQDDALFLEMVTSVDR